MSFKFPIYLDYHSTTPVDPRVYEVMKPYFCEEFGNPASGSHVFGWKAEEVVKQARQKVAHLIGVRDPKEIIWTSGTTESINLALRGASISYREKGQHIISCVTEHKAALETLKYLETQGFKVTYLPVDSYGVVDPEDVRKNITDKTILISFMAANNEIGTLHPISEIGKIAKEKEVLFHVDAAQACGKIPMDVEKMGIDLLSASAHKVYGPKGIGILYKRERSPYVSLSPLFFGGGHEKGLRPGTLAVPLIVGMGEAFKIAGQEMEEEKVRIITLREKLYHGLKNGLEDIELNGHPQKRLPGNLNVSFSGIKASDLISHVRDVALSSGSACASGSLEPSYVLKALGFSDERARSSIRFGLGRFTTEEEIDCVIEKVVEAVQKLRHF